METRISHRALKQSQNELRVCCGRCILFSASNPGSVHSLRQKLNPVSQEVSKPASAPAPTNKNANRLRTIVMKTQKQIRWPTTRCRQQSIISSLASQTKNKFGSQRKQLASHWCHWWNGEFRSVTWIPRQDGLSFDWIAFHW